MPEKLFSRRQFGLAAGATALLFLLGVRVLDREQEREELEQHVLYEDFDSASVYVDFAGGLYKRTSEVDLYYGAGGKILGRKQWEFFSPTIWQGYINNEPKVYPHLGITVDGRLLAVTHHPPFGTSSTRLQIESRLWDYEIQRSTFPFSRLTYKVSGVNNPIVKEIVEGIHVKETEYTPPTSESVREIDLTPFSEDPLVILKIRTTSPKDPQQELIESKLYIDDFVLYRK